MINVSNEFKTLMSERQDFKEYAEVTCKWHSFRTDRG